MHGLPLPEATPDSEMLAAIQTLLRTPPDQHGSSAARCDAQLRQHRQRSPPRAAHSPTHSMTAANPLWFHHRFFVACGRTTNVARRRPACLCPSQITSSQRHPHRPKTMGCSSRHYRYGTWTAGHRHSLLLPRCAVPRTPEGVVTVLKESFKGEQLSISVEMRSVANLLGLCLP
jgi:hypothetical protein